MNPKLKALVGACGILFCCAMIGVTVVQIFSMIPMSWVPWLGVTFLISMALYVIYNILLNEMETKAKLKELSDQK